MAFKSPAAIVESICTLGSTKARLKIPQQIVLGFLAGAYVALGGLLALMVGKGSPTLAKADPGLAALAFGALFPLGFVLVTIAGAELFTENCAIVTLCLAGAARWRALGRSLGLTYVGNLAGALFVALFVGYWTGIANGGVLGPAAAQFAEGKVQLEWGQALLCGIGGNWLACLAVWMAITSDGIAGKIAAIWFPIMAFVTLGLEHSVANMFFIPLGMFNGAQVGIVDLLWRNLVPVTIGNIIGGAGFVGAIYWWIYGGISLHNGDDRLESSQHQ